MNCNQPAANQPAAEKQHGRAVIYRYIVILVLEMVKFRENCAKNENKSLIDS